MKRYLWLTTILVALTGCVATIPTRGEYLAKHRDLPARIHNGIATGTAVIGMTKEQATIALQIDPFWYRPRIHKTITSSGVHEQWVILRRTFLYFDNGILTCYQKW